MQGLEENPPSLDGRLDGVPIPLCTVERTSRGLPENQTDHIDALEPQRGLEGNQPSPDGRLEGVPMPWCIVKRSHQACPEHLFHCLVYQCAPRCSAVL